MPPPCENAPFADARFPVDVVVLRVLDPVGRMKKHATVLEVLVGFKMARLQNLGLQDVGHDGQNPDATVAQPSGDVSHVTLPRDVRISRVDAHPSLEGGVSAMALVELICNRVDLDLPGVVFVLRSGVEAGFRV